MESRKPEHSNQVWFIRHEGRVDGPYLSSEIRHQLTTAVITVDDLISENRENWHALKHVPEVLPLELRAELGDQAAKKTIAMRRELKSEKDDRQRSMVGVWLPLASLTTLAVVAVLVTIWLWEPVVIADPQCDTAANPSVDWRYCRKSGLNLADSDLTAANLTNNYLQQTNLSGAKLQGTLLTYSNLSGANLSYSDLSGANLKGANLTNADLTYSTLSSADLSFADLTGARLGGAKFENTRLGQAIWVDGNECMADSLDECRKAPSPLQ